MGRLAAHQFVVEKIRPEAMDQGQEGQPVRPRRGEVVDVDVGVILRAHNRQLPSRLLGATLGRLSNRRKTQ